MRNFTGRLLLAASGLLLLTTAHNVTVAASNGGTGGMRAEEHRWLTEHPVILDMQRLINEERARYNLEPLKIDPKMCLKAQEHAVWMANSGSFSHSNYPWPEIIYHGADSVESAVQGWIWSGPHHSIMLRSNAKVAGYGYMVRNGHTYWVGVFQ